MYKRKGGEKEREVRKKDVIKEEVWRRGKGEEKREKDSERDRERKRKGKRRKWADVC